MARDFVAELPSQDSLSDLSRRIAEADVVSFDMFDTLFVRPLTDSEDVFDILGETYGIDNFRALRKAAQVEAFRRMQADGRNEIDLDGIYACFDTLAVPAEQLRKAEYDLELEITLPNAEIIAVFQHALALDKRVVITSDMYLPLGFFEELLDRHDLRRVPLFISSARNATKRDHGALFDVVALELGVSHHQILHIGDNEASDVQRAKAKGLRTWLYREARVPGRRRGLSPGASLARGLVRLHQAAVPPGSLHELGFLKGGPAALGFLDWIAAQARRDAIDHILFVSRDGYVLRELWQNRGLDGEPAGSIAASYLLGSRVSFTLAGMDEVNFAEHLPFLMSGADDLSPVELLARIGVPAPAEHVMRDMGLGDEMTFSHRTPQPALNLLRAWMWEILKVCRNNRRGLLRHLLALGVRPGQRVAIVDIGWNGSAQEAFERAVRQLMALDVFGYYFCLANSVESRRRRDGMRMKALIGLDSVSAELVNAVYANRVACEIFFSASHDPVIGYVEGACGITAVEDRGRAETGDIAATVRGIQAGMIDFARCFRPRQLRLGLKPDPLGMAMPLLEFIADGQWADHARLSRIKNFDSWASSRNRDMWLRDYAVKGYATG